MLHPRLRLLPRGGQGGFLTSSGSGMLRAVTAVARYGSSLAGRDSIDWFSDDAGVFRLHLGRGA
jgi:hypothetical protein